MRSKIVRFVDNLYPYITRKKRKKNINKIWKETSDEEREKIYDTYDKYTKNAKSFNEVIKILKDIRYMKYVYGFKYEEYFIFGFKNKILKVRKSFVAGREMKEFIAYLNPPEEKKILRDKYSCYLKYKDFYKREIIKIEDDSDFNKFKSFIDKNEKFVKKPYNKAFGRGIELIDSSKYDNKKQLFNDLLSEGSVVLEEVIVQNERMKVLHPSSVNTIRMIPFIKKDGEIIIHIPFIKIGKNNSFVDNGGAGGILALIDPETGKIMTDAYDEMCNRYKVHPNSGVKIKGFQIPEWEEAVNLAKSLAPLHPKLKYIGWDMAFSNKGWIVVEGNGATQFIGQQLPDGKGKKKEFEKLIGYKISKK